MVFYHRQYPRVSSWEASVYLVKVVERYGSSSRSRPRARLCRDGRTNVANRPVCARARNERNSRIVERFLLSLGLFGHVGFNVV